VATVQLQSSGIRRRLRMPERVPPLGSHTQGIAVEQDRVHRTIREELSRQHGGCETAGKGGATTVSTGSIRVPRAGAWRDCVGSRRHCWDEA
jgi:hypothetical protein